MPTIMLVYCVIVSQTWVVTYITPTNETKFVYEEKCEAPTLTK